MSNPTHNDVIGSSWGVRPYNGLDYSLPSSVPEPLVDPLIPVGFNDDDRRGIVHAIGVVVLVVAYAVLILVVGLRRSGLAMATPSNWRPAFSPGRGAFSIWCLIFTLLFTTIAYQLSAIAIASVRVPQCYANLSLATSFILSAAWLDIFRDGSDRVRVRIAALVLVAAAATALLAATMQDWWWTSNSQRMAIPFLALPIGLYTGWMLVASTLSVGTAVLSVAPPTPPYKIRSYTILDAAEKYDRTSPASWVPLALAVGASAVATSFTDPFILLPLIWALCFIRGHAKNLLAIEVLVVVNVSIVIYIVARW